MKLTRVRISIRGAVQGVGFRPFIYRLAKAAGLSGWVSNTTWGVAIEVEGPTGEIEKFLLRIQKEKPPHASIQSMEFSHLDVLGYCLFEIRSSLGGQKSAIVIPDIATCPDCMVEVSDPNNRRYRYPFTNCTHCGPRYSIVRSVPYDRPNTTMRRFTMCPTCQAEYEDPCDRRFHAQPNACGDCGPSLEACTPDGKIYASKEDALTQTVLAIKGGAIAAIKGLGGFHLFGDSRDEKVLQKLRIRKHREEKPFALMFPSLELIREYCEVSPLEERLLTSPEAPIVLLRRKGFSPLLAEGVAPGNPYLGVMLAYTPLHHLLLRDLGFPVLATSGNIGDDPLCIDNRDALARLGGIAEVFLMHDRPIARHLDDSIVRVLLGRELVLRRARGYAPLPVPIQNSIPPLLAVGGHLKNTVAYSLGQNVFLSQHIGDLETPKALEHFESTIKGFQRLYGAKATAIVHDAHTGYTSTQYAKDTKSPCIAVQHHYAHVLSCMAENDLKGSVLGVAWDGTGLGTDGTIWGGEFLLIGQDSYERVAHLRPFPLPGGDKASREPRRSAVGLLWTLFEESMFLSKGLLPLNTFSASELSLLKEMLAGKIRCPMTSSVGRLFDAVASLVGLRHRLRFEGQAAMELEFALQEVKTSLAYPFSLHGEKEGSQRKRTLVVDWEPMVLELLDEVGKKVSAGILAAKFHNTLVEMIVAVAKTIGEQRVVMSGGCFQNVYLTERAVRRLLEEGFTPYWHQRIPPNDGGIALGQIMAAARVRDTGDMLCV